MANLVITATHNFTAIGHGSDMTASSVRAGVSRHFTYDDYLDSESNPITTAMIEGIDDGPDISGRITKAACLSLEELLESYQGKKCFFPQTHLLLGVSARHRHGMRFEACMSRLTFITKKRSDCISTHVFPHGNASFMRALKQAEVLISNAPDTVCIIGCIDSLLSKPTLDWLEKQRRLKSITKGRLRGLIPGEAVGFMIVEDAQRALRHNRRIQAYISGIGIAKEPAPRATNTKNRAVGLTNACRTALGDMAGDDVKSILGDLNGEVSRANEWGITETRCFGNEGTPQLFHPADNYGDIGAASGITLASIAAQGLNEKWLHEPSLVFCSDDHGICGAVILRSSLE